MRPPASIKAFGERSASPTRRRKARASARPPDAAETISVIAKVPPEGEIYARNLCDTSQHSLGTSGKVRPRALTLRTQPAVRIFRRGAGVLCPQPDRYSERAMRA